MKVKDLKEELNHYDDNDDVFTDCDEFILGIYKEKHPFKSNKDAVFLETTSIIFNNSN